MGSALISAESELLSEALEDVFGWELLQIGAWGTARDLLAGSRTRRQTIISPIDFPSGADVIARPSLLPVTSDSVDAVILPHSLEFAADPYAILREADSVLVGEGQLLVLGFRPWSLWGLRAQGTRSGFPPGMRRVLPERRVRDWLVLLGYEVVMDKKYLYLGPWSAGRKPGDKEGDSNARILRRGFVNPLPANAYILKARKRVYTLTPIRPRFREKAGVIGGFAEPTTRREQQG